MGMGQPFSGSSGEWFGFRRCPVYYHLFGYVCENLLHFQFKTQMQIQIIRAKSGATIQYRHVFHAGWVIAKTQGVRGVYQGLGATWMRNTPANGIYFGK